MKTNYVPTAKLLSTADDAYITTCVNGETITMRKVENPENFDKALAAYRKSDWESLYTLMRPMKKYIENFNGVEVDNKTGEVLWNGEPMHHVVLERVSEFATNGIDYKPLCAFFNKLMKNPSSRAVRELYTFLEHKHMPITDNGNFLAYKGICSNWYSCTAGKKNILVQGKTNEAGQIYNGIGEVIEFPRNEVDDDKEVGCSHGLHAGTYEYASGFAQGRLVLVEINPADVISIPTDCQFQKLRCCRYKVVDSFEVVLTEPLYDSKWDDDDDVDIEGLLLPDMEDDDGLPEGFGISEEYLLLLSDALSDEDETPPCGCDECTCTFEEDFGYITLEFECSESAWIKEVEYYSPYLGKLVDTDEGVLVIWTTDGRDLVYRDIPYGLAVEFQTTVNDGGSAGKFYNSRIKPHYNEG